jgi:hypothetical protein
MVFTEGKKIDRPGFLVEFILLKPLELISRKKWQPGPKAAIPKAIMANKSYHGITDQSNGSNGSISNVMKLFIASGGVIHRFTNGKTPDRNPKTG